MWDKMVRWDDDTGIWDAFFFSPYVLLFFFFSFPMFWDRCSGYLCFVIFIGFSFLFFFFLLVFLLSCFYITHIYEGIFQSMGLGGLYYSPVGTASSTD